MTEFKQICLELPFFEIFDLLHVYKNDEGNGLKYFEAKTKLDFIPAKYRKDFYAVYLEIDANAPPHVDNFIKTAINFYIAPDNCTTNFYKIIVDNPNIIESIENGDGGIYRLSELENIGSFCATENEVWILDVSVPHSVNCNKDEPPLRKILQICTDKYNINEVFQMISEQTNKPSLHAQYIKERENIDMLEIDHGFATFKKLDDGSFYIIDIFVEEGHRKSGLARSMADSIAAIAKESGASKLIGSVCINVSGVTESMAALIAYGMKFSHGEGFMLYFSKDIGE